MRNCKYCDEDQIALEIAERSEVGKLLSSRLTPRPTAKMLMVTNPNTAKDAYWQYRDSENI